MHAPRSIFIAALVALAPGLARADAKQHAAALSEREKCGRDEVLCVDELGDGLAGDGLPAMLVAGAVVTVKVLGCRSEQVGVSYSIDQTTVQSPDRLTRESSTTQPAARAAPTCDEAANFEVLKDATLTVPGDPRVIEFAVKITRVKGSESTVKSYAAAVAHGRYFVDVGVLIPIVIDGDREVVADDTDQPNLKRLRVRNDLEVFPALMINVFPGGRDFGALGSFRTAACVARSGGLDRARVRPACRRRRAANSLGLQFGPELDFRTFSRLYFGGLFEPVSGFSINVGVALTRQQYLRRGTYDGALIPTPMTVRDDGSPDLRAYTEQKWSPRLYIGITLSLDILRYFGTRRRSSDLGTILPQ